VAAELTTLSRHFYESLSNLKVVLHPVALFATTAWWKMKGMRMLSCSDMTIYDVPNMIANFQLANPNPEARSPESMRELREVLEKSYPQIHQVLKSTISLSTLFWGIFRVKDRQLLHELLVTSKYLWLLEYRNAK